MDRLIYVSMSGASETMKAQALHANNLANVSTPGFKAQLEEARSMPVYGDGFPSRVYAAAEAPGYNYQPGSARSTGNDLHFAVTGEGWIAVQANDGTEAYTRRGDLTRDINNFLINGAGFKVLGTGGPITIPPAESISIAQDGTISFRPLGSGPATIAVLDQIKLVKADVDNFKSRDDGLFVTKTGAPLENDPGVRIASGVVETSNVNPVAELIDIIALARRHELDVKMMHTAEENDRAAAQILQLT